MTRFHFERPDGVSGSPQNILVHLNEFVPPQGFDGAVAPPVDVAMAYEDLTPMAYENPNWFNQSWQQRTSLIINATKVPSTIPDFPLLINESISNLIGATEAELRFVDEFQRPMPFEIESFNSGNGALLAHSKKLFVNGGEPVYIYFDNPGALDGQNAPAVWSNGYMAVWHMDNLLDSTGNGNTLTATGTTIVAGQIGNCRNLNASNLDFLEAADSPSLAISGDQFTMSTWARSTTGGIIINKDNFPGTRGYSMRDNGTIRYGIDSVGDGNDFVNGTINPPNAFTQITCTYDGITMRLYVDAVPDGTRPKTGNIVVSDVSFMIGKRADNVLFYNGPIDEVRISNVVRSADYITTEFNNQDNPASFYTNGPLENRTSFLPTITMGYET